MDDKDIGAVAGKVWDYLDKNGKKSVISIKTSLQISNTRLFLAAGWLAREDKIIISHEGKEPYIELKK